MSGEEKSPQDELSKTRPSTASSVTNVLKSGDQSREPSLSPGHGDPAIAEKKIEEGIENIKDDWENDPENARNWSFGKKWTTVGIVSAYTFVSPLASSMMAPALPEVATKYGITSPTIVALTLSIFLLSYAIGPLILAPLSEMYGRTWVLHIANLFTLAFSFGCAYAPNTGALIGFRCLSGLSGSAPIAIGGGSVGDLFAEKDRASAMAIFSLGPLIGPVIGPIAGGFIAQTVGVRYVFIVIAGCCAVAALLGIPFLKETYAPVIRLRRDKFSGDLEKAAMRHADHTKPQESKLRILWHNLSRPITLLFTNFVCFILSLYMAFMYGIFYLMFSTFGEFFSTTYGFSPGIGGLTYLGLGLGFAMATVFGAKTADQVYQYLSKKNGGKGTPEMRMPALFFGSFFVPVGLFWYGWSANAKIHWIMPITGSGIFAFGMMTTFLPIQLYLVDAFTYAASAVGAAAVIRSLFGFIFPLFGQQMFNAMGIGGGNSMLAGLAILLGIPFPVWIYYRGEALRLKSKVAR